MPLMTVVIAFSPWTGPYRRPTPSGNLACGFGRSWCANVRRCRIHPSRRQCSAAVPLLSGHACTKLLQLTDLSLLPALLPCCDNATMVDAKTPAATTPQRWMIRPTYDAPDDFCPRFFPLDWPIEDQPPLATWPCWHVASGGHGAPM